MVKRSPSSSCSSNSSTNSYSNEPEIVQLKPEKKPKPRKRAKRVDNNHIDHHDHDDASNDSNIKLNNAKKNQSSGKRSSIYRGVTRHRWTGRFEAHLWDKSCWNNVQNKKGRQVYLGAYDSEEAAARTYDLAALKYWGPTTILNFTIDSYTKDVEEMEKVTREEYLASLRRRSSGFSRGVSKYRGVARHHHNGRWEARIGRVFGNKYLYLGTYKTQEEAAAAYDMAAIEYRGVNAVTNFDISNYLDRLKVETTSPNPDDATSAPSPPPPPPPLPLPTPPQAVADPHLQAPLPCLDVDHPDLAWGYLDAGFVSLPIDKSGELLDLFDDVTGFEDNIDQIFGPSSGFDVQVDSGNGGGGQSGSALSSPDTQSSTITSVSCM